MKKFAAITISLCAALAAVFCGGKTALADGAETTVYPEDEFVCRVEDKLKNVSDYAVSGNKYAFADGNSVVFIENESRTVYEIGSAVSALDCESGVFYYKDGSGKTYSLPEKQEAEHEFAELTEFKPIVLDDGSLYRLLPNELRYYEKNDPEGAKVGQDVVFSKIKNYGNEVFALCEKQLYRISGTAANAVALTFTDYSATDTIPIGTTAEKLLNYNVNELHFVTINGGAYMSEIDLDKLTGENFKAPATGENASDLLSKHTAKSGENGAPAAGKKALLLCTTGENDSVAIVMIANKCYIMNASNTQPETSGALTEPDSAHTAATVSITSAYAYSSPYVSDGTKLFSLKSGDSVQILGVVSMTEVLGTLDFYKIKYVGEDGVEVVGYVPFGYVSGFSEFNEKEPSKTEDPEFTEDNVVKTVVLVLVVVALVLIAAGYITYVVTSGRKKKKSEQTENKVK